jgi:DNA polymerase III epsilon subunit-like protein
MKNYALSIFNEKTKKQFMSLSEEEKLSAFNKVKQMPDDVDIRNIEDTMISIALRKRGLNVFDKNKISPWKQFLKDFYSIPEEMRIDKVAVFDTETTDRYNAYAVSLAIVIVDLKDLIIEKEYYTLINPQDYIKEEAYEIHKISNEEVVNEKNFKELENTISSYFENIETLVGHNLDFDLKVMEREYNRINKENPLLNKNVIDTMIMSKEIVEATDVKGKLKNPRLEEAIEYFNLKKPEGEYHNALVDTKACAEVLIALFKHENNNWIKSI